MQQKTAPQRKRTYWAISFLMVFICCLAGGRSNAVEPVWIDPGISDVQVQQLAATVTPHPQQVQ